MSRETSWKKKTIAFLISQAITLFGSTLVQMAIVWYVTLDTSSGFWVSALTVCSYLPQFLISFIGGVWADRYNRKKLIIAADTLIAVTTLILALLMPHISDNNVLLIAILIVSVVRSIGAGIQTPAVNAVIPQLVPENALMKFNGINAAVQSTVQFAAPAAAGAILTFGTLRSTLFIDVATAVVGVGVLACIGIPAVIRQKQEEKVSVFADMKIGLKYAFSDKMLSKLLTSYGLFIFLCVPAGFLSALLVSRVFGDEYSYLTAVELVGFAGMAAGGMLMGIWGGFKNRCKTLVVGMLMFAALAVGMGLTQNFIFYLVLMAVYGIAITVIQTASTTLIQENAQEAMQGRVFGLMGSMYSGFLPIGMAVFGPLADIMPLKWLMIGSGVGLLLIAVVLRFSKAFYKNKAGTENNTSAENQASAEN